MLVYLKDIPQEQASMVFAEALKKAQINGILGSETIPLNEKCSGRILTAPIWAKISSPNYHSAAMDGFAVLAKNTIGASPTHPIKLKVPDQAVYVDTGDPIPDGINAVIPIEFIEPEFPEGSDRSDHNQITAIVIRSASSPWSHIRPMGEDIVASELILASGSKLRPADLNAMAASGNETIQVSRIPKVAIIPTGDELVKPCCKPEPGTIIESNSLMLAAYINEWGGKASRFEIVKDDLEKLVEIIKQAASEHDLVIVNAGSSAGSEDFTALAITKLGEVLVHGVAIRPGHPVILGIISMDEKGKKIPIIGLPGYPVSAALAADLFVKPLIKKWLGESAESEWQINASLTKKVVSPAGDDDYLRVVVGKVGQKYLAVPLARGAGVITSIVKADGFVCIPRGTQGIDAGTQVSIRLLRNPDRLEKTIFAIGSHDVTLDLLAQELAGSNRRLVSANVGSQGGLLAIQRGEAHLAGCHLLDPSTGIYNISSIKEYIPNKKVHLIRWVSREQGLMIAKGNPKNILSLDDLVRKDVFFVNRQRGSGTRVLLDYHLKQKGIDTKSVNGYELEEFTHLAVAADVASNRSDCGLGIAAAAEALALDFIPLFQEQYDLIIPDPFFDDELLKPVFEIMHNPTFYKSISALAGYKSDEMGLEILRD